MNRRAAIAAVVTVTLVFFVIRLGIRMLAREAAPPSSPVVTQRSPNSPVALDLPRTPEQLKGDAQAKLLTLASEARAAKETKVAALAYDAERALQKDDCGAAQNALADATTALSPDSPVKGAVDSATRSVNVLCRAPSGG